MAKLFHATFGYCLLYLYNRSQFAQMKVGSRPPTLSKWVSLFYLFGTIIV